MPDQSKRYIRIAHMGDVGLDRPLFHTPSANDREHRREEIKRTFRTTLERIAREGIDVLLLTGNLFDNTYLTADTAARILSLFAAMPCRIFISPGPLDAATYDSLWVSREMPPNVHVFRTNTPERIDLPALGLSVFGWGSTAPDNVFSPLAKGIPAGEGGCLILCGHVARPGEEGVTVTPDEIAASNADYAALSDGGRFRGFSQCGKTIVGFSGPAEPRDYDMGGPGGMNTLDISFPDTVLTRDEPISLHPEHQIIGSHRYLNLTLDLTGVTSSSALTEAVGACIRERNLGADDSLRVIYTGITTPSLVLPTFRDEGYFGLAELTVVDESLPFSDDTEFALSYSARGVLFRNIRDDALATNPEKTEKEKEIAAKALRFVLSALDNGDINQL